MYVEVEESFWNECQSLMLQVMKFARKQLTVINNCSEVPEEISAEFDELNKKVCKIFHAFWGQCI